MSAKPIVHSRWLKGLQAGFDRFSQPKGSVSRVSNLLLTRRGAWKTCDGSRILSAFGGLSPQAFNPLLNFLWRELYYYAPSSGIRTGYYGLYSDPGTHLASATGTPVLSALATGLTGTYFVKITAVDGVGGESAASAEAGPIVLANNGLHVTWSAVANAYGYNIYVATVSGQEVLWLPAGSLATAPGVSSVGGTITAVTIDNTWITNANQTPPSIDTTQALIFTSVPIGGYSAANVIKQLPAAIGAISTSAATSTDTSSTPITSTSEKRPTTAAQGGPVGGTGSFGNTSLAYDDNFSTNALGTDQTDEFSNPGPGTEETWSGFPASGGGTITAITLNVNSAFSLLLGSGSGRAIVEYSLNGGGTWHSMFDTFTPYTQSTTSATLPVGQDLTQLKVSAYVQCITGKSHVAQMRVYEIWCSVTTQVASGGGSGSGGLGTGGGTPNGGVLGVSGPLPMIVSLQGKMVLALGNGIQPYLSDGTTAGTTQNANTFTAVYPSRTASTVYGVGDQIEATVSAVAYVFTATQGGQTDSGGAPAFAATLGSTVVDGAVIWKNTGQVSGSPAPRGAAHAEIYAGSLWVANTSPTLTTDQLDGPSALRMSDLNNPVSWNPLNAAQISPDDGDECNGIKAFTIAEAGIAPQNFLMYFKNFSSYLIQGVFGASNFAITRLQTDLGCVASRTLQFIPGYGIVRLTHLGFAVTDGIGDKLQDPESIRPYLFPENTESDITPIDWSQAWFSKAAQTVNPPMYVAALPLQNAGSDLLNTLTGVAVSAQANVLSTLPTGSYYVQVGLRSPIGVTSLSAVSSPVAVTVNSTMLQVVMTDPPPAGYLGFRVWFGTDPTDLNQYIDTNVQTINIATTGSGGNPPTGIGGMLTRVFCYDLIVKAWTIIDLPFAISVLRQFRAVGSIPITLAAGTYDGAIRQLQGGDEQWDAGAVRPADSDVEWSMEDAEVYLQGATVRMFMNKIVERGTGSPPSINFDLSINGRPHQVVIDAITALATSQYEARTHVMRTGENFKLMLSGTGPATIESIDYQAEPKPVGGELIIS